MNTVSIPYAYKKKKKQKDKQKEKETKNQNQKKNQKSAASSKSRVVKERRSVALCAIGLGKESALPDMLARFTMEAPDERLRRKPHKACQGYQRRNGGSHPVPDCLFDEARADDGILFQSNAPAKAIGVLTIQRCALAGCEPRRER